VRLLIKARADLALKNNNGWTPLAIASDQKGRREAVQLIKDAGGR